MRVLQLTTSDAFFDTGIADEDRVHAVAQRALIAATGEPVETTVRGIALAPELPEIIDRWMVRYEPDMVVFHINPYWYLYPSIPRRLERKFGRAGKKVGSIGSSSGPGQASWLSQRRVYHWGRRLALRTFGGDYFHTPEQIIEATAHCVRRILLRNEDVVLVVRGTLMGRKDSPIARALAVHNGMARVAEELHFTWLSRDPTLPPLGDAYLRTGDRFHTVAEVQRIEGELVGAAMAKAWQEAHATQPVAPVPAPAP